MHENAFHLHCSPHLAGMPRQLARLPNMLGYTAYDRQLRSQVQLCESPVGSMTPAPGTVKSPTLASGSKQPTSGSRRKNSSHHLASSCLKLFEFCVYSCMYSANFRNKNMHGQEKERNDLYIHHLHGIS